MSADRAATIRILSELSGDAIYMMAQDWFGSVMTGKPILAVASNPRQEAAFQELLEHGFAHGDMERGQYGYRSTWKGREARDYLADFASTRVVTARSAIAKAEGTV